MARFTLSRRTVLRGAAGAAVALPPLEIMNPRGGRAHAAACTIPKRFVMLYAGVSHGGLQRPIGESVVIPKAIGAGYELARGIKSIGGGTVGSGATQSTYTSVKPYMGLCSGLEVPISLDANIPPAGRSALAGFHGTTTTPQTCGEKESGLDENTITDAPRKGSSAEQIVADAIKGTTPLGSIYFRAQPSRYFAGDGGPDGYISYRSARRQSPIISLKQAYNTLFSVGGAVNGKTLDVSAFIDRRKSILDLVLDKSTSLKQRLGAADKIKLDQYYEEIRSLENTLGALKMKSGTVACKPPVAPEDPPVGAGFLGGDYDPDMKDSYLPAIARCWSDEETRAQVMTDFLHLALSCDITRSALFHLTVRQCYMTAAQIIPSGNKLDLHSLGHGYDQVGLGEMADIVDWHVKHMARLVSKLRDTTECDGSRVIDHCALSMLFEGGHGKTGDPTRIDDSHSTENMIVVVAGGAGGLKSGQHVHFKNDRHPAQVLLTHMKAVGVPDGTPLGEIAADQALPELLTTG